MRILFIYRNPKIAHSIHRVFRTLVSSYSAKDMDIVEYNTPSIKSNPLDAFINIFFVWKRREYSSIHHITGHTHEVLLGLIGFKTVLTVHDLVFLDNISNPLKKLYKWLFWFYLPIKIADKVVCISKKTKSDIERKISVSNLFVIYNPIDPIFCYSPQIFNYDKPIVLHIGTGWNKNLLRSITALMGIPCHLRIVGKLSNEHISLLNSTNTEYSNVFNLSDEQIFQEYINCDLVNFPSEYEGFGMPIIEGQQTGRVVVTSYLEPLIEVSGGAVVFVDPYDVSSIRNGYIDILSDKDKRERIIMNGLINVKRFLVEDVSRQYLELYRSLD